MGKKRKFEIDQEESFEVDPIPQHLQIGHVKNSEKRLIIVLENAQLETVSVSLFGFSVAISLLLRPVDQKIEISNLRP